MAAWVPPASAPPSSPLRPGLEPQGVPLHGVVGNTPDSCSREPLDLPMLSSTGQGSWGLLSLSLSPHRPALLGQSPRLIICTQCRPQLFLRGKPQPTSCLPQAPNRSKLLQEPRICPNSVVDTAPSPQRPGTGCPRRETGKSRQVAQAEG